jgi:hypothetical protein
LASSIPRCHRVQNEKLNAAAAQFATDQRSWCHPGFVNYKQIRREQQGRQVTEALVPDFAGVSIESQ